MELGSYENTLNDHLFSNVAGAYHLPSQNG